MKLLAARTDRRHPFPSHRSLLSETKLRQMTCKNCRAPRGPLGSRTPHRRSRGAASSACPGSASINPLHGNFVITSFADIVRDGATLEASSNTNSRYFTTKNETVKPEPYEHGFTIKVSPLLGFPKPDTVYARITIEGNTVMDFLPKIWH